MATKNHLDKALEQNPQIDRSKVRAGLAALRALRKLGVKPKGYSSRSPFLSRKRVRTIGDSDKSATESSCDAKSIRTIPQE